MNHLEHSITEALSVTDPTACNRAITLCHYELSQALRRTLGPDAGGNFHSWAVWGSKKAGTTIREEDLEPAKDNATRAGGVAGFGVGVAVARALSRVTGRELWYGVGSVVGPVTGAYCGQLLAIWSRKKAAALVLEGNKLVLNDIGRVTARFLARFPDGVTEDGLETLLSELPEGLLRRAFQAYGRAGLAKEVKQKHEACYFGNCLAILYEHQKLQPYIKGAMPLIVRRCVTKRLLTFDIGNQQLAVSSDVPGIDRSNFPKTLERLEDGELVRFLEKWDRNQDATLGSRASDWTSLPQRMNYILALFRRFHLDPNVIAEPELPEPCL